jgi:hypothetical protein
LFENCSSGLLFRLQHSLRIIANATVRSDRMFPRAELLPCSRRSHAPVSAWRECRPGLGRPFFSSNRSAGLFVALLKASPVEKRENRNSVESPPAIRVFSNDVDVNFASRIGFAGAQAEGRGAATRLFRTPFKACFRSARACSATVANTCAAARRCAPRSQSNPTLRLSFGSVSGTAASP